MKKLLSFIVLTTLFIVSFAQIAKADVITLRADAWCPYNCAPADANPGYVIEIAKEIFEKAGHTVDYKTLNWARAVDDVKNGTFTGAVGAAKEDAPELVYPKLSVGKSTNVFAVRADDNFEYKGIESLDGKLLGIIDGYAYTNIIDDYISKYKNDNKRILTTPGNEALSVNLGKLVAKRLDLVIEDGNVLDSEIAKLKLGSRIKVLRKVLPVSDIYIAFSPKNPKSQEYANLFDSGLEKLRAEGKLETILAKYGVKDWK